MNRRVFQVSCAMALACASSAIGAPQAEKNTNQAGAVQVPLAVVPQIPPGPSLDEIKAWIARELPAIGSYSHVLTGGTSSITNNYEIETALLSDCRLILHTAVQHTYFKTSPREQGTITLSLKDMDVEGMVPYTAPPPRGNIWKENRPEVSIRFRAIEDRGEPFTTEGPKLNERTADVSVHVRDLESATKVVEAVRRAVVLCADLPAPPAAAKMTNADVIQLVTAGLSDQVITASIRNAPNKEFDLKPIGLIALKKAGVSDALLLIMQDSGTSAGGPVFTSARARQEAERAAQSALAASATGKFYRHGKASDYVELKAGGTFELHEGKKTYLGKYRVTGHFVTLTADGSFGECLISADGKPNRLLAPGDSTLRANVVVTSTSIEDVRSSSYWER